MTVIKLCEYGCGNEAKYLFKNGVKCCSSHKNSCPENIKKRCKKGVKKEPPIEVITTDICSYGCGNIAKYKYKNGKYCCSISRNKCPFMRKKNRDGNIG